MKNKYLLKVLSMGALSSLLVTPLVLNGAIDSVQEEVITQSADDSQKSVKRASTTSEKQVNLSSNNVGGMFYIAPDSNGSYSNSNCNGTMKTTFSNNCLETSAFSKSSALMRGYLILTNLDSSKTYKFYLDYLNEDMDYYIRAYNITKDNWINNMYTYTSTFTRLQQLMKPYYISESDYVEGRNAQCSAIVFGGVSSVILEIGNESLTGGETLFPSFDCSLFEDSNSVDIQQPVVTASKYAISLPVKTSTRLTKEYLLNQKIFKVTDDTDGDITDRLVIKSGDINYDKTGTYPLVLSWSDNAGNESTLTFNVLIGDFEKPSYSIKQSTMYVECPNKLSEADLLNNVTFSDNYDTSISKTIVTNNYNQNTNCGTYSVTIRGTDTSGNYTEATFNVCVRDTIAPTITGITNNQVIKSANVRVSDSGSGIKSVTIDDKSAILADGEFAFNASSYADGIHTLKATDNQGNGTIIKFISDKSAPTITGIDSSTRLNKSVTITLADTYSDIVSFKLNGTLIEVNAKTKEITLGADNLVQGTNKITELKDLLGNVASDLSFVYDTIAPVITPNVSGGGSIKSGDYITSEQVKAQFTATDEVDGSCAISVVSSTIEDRVGKYVVVLRSVDKTGNATEISVNVERLDVTAPVIFIKSSDDVTIMKVASGTEITYENLLNIFNYLYQDKVNAQDCSVEVLSDGFVANGTESQVVRYMVTNNVTGDTTMYSLDYQSYVMASDDKKDDNKTDDDKKDDTNKDNNKDESKAENWFVRVFKGIGNFFKKIWNFITDLFGGNKDTDVKTTDKVKSSVTTPEVTTEPDIATDDNNNEAEYIVW